MPLTEPLIDHSETKADYPEDVPRPPEDGLSTAEAERLLAIHGFNELAEEERNPLLEFLGNFWGPMPIMIWIAIIIEGIPKFNSDTGKTEIDWADFIVLFVLQMCNGLVSWYEHSKAADAVQALKESLSPKAQVKRNGEWVELAARELVPGDLVSLALGSTVPADCQVLGPKQIYCDQAALTGESLPVKIDVGEKAKMGSNVTTGECDAVVTGTGDKTFFGKTAKLIAGVQETGHFQKVLYKITGVLMGLSLILTGIILASLIISNVNTLEALGICVVLLVASIPIAMQVVCTSTMAIGSRKLAEKKAIVTRLAAIEELAGMNMLCSDKTGTLTLGKMQMQEILVYSYDDESADIGLVDGADSLQPSDIMRFACLAAKWYEPPRDAIDRLVIGSAESGKYGDIFGELDDFEHLDYMPFDPKYKRTESQVRRRSDQSVEYKVTKGAPQVILSMCNSCPAEQVHAISNKISELAARGIRSLGIAVCKAQAIKGADESEGGDVEVGFTNWRFIGILTFLDPPRHDTKRTVERALDLGIDVKMITGDQVAIAKETCFQLGMGTNIRGTELIPDGETASSADAIRFEEIIVELDGFAEVFPEHKYQIVNTFRKIGYRCGMTGDGVNDAPALKRADIGIAVQGATDAARAAADIVLTQEGLSVIIDAIYISRKIFKRMKNYVTYRIAILKCLLLFFFIAVLSVHPNHYPICIGTWHGENDYCLPAVWKSEHNNTLPSAVCDQKDIRNNTLPCVCKNTDIHDGTPFQTVAPEGVSCNPSYFKLPVIALVLITILNDGTIISIAYDHVVPNKYPEKWRLPRVIIEATLLGGVACVSSIVLLELAMNAGSKDDVLSDVFGMKTLVYNQVTCLMYLKVSISDFLTVFAARTQGFFFMRKPGTALAIAFVVATTASSIFAHLWPFVGMEGLPGEYILFTWIYCILCFFVQDICKVCLNLVLDALMFGVEDGTAGDPDARRQKDAHRLARVRLAEEKHRHKGTVSSPDMMARRSFSQGLPSLGLGGTITNTEDIRLRIDVLAQELERLRGALSAVSNSGGGGSSARSGMGSGSSLGRSGMNSGGLSKRTNRSNLSSRSLSHEFVHRSQRDKSPSVGSFHSSKSKV
eukprot:g1572.t1